MTKRPLCMVCGLDAPYVCGRPGRISTDQRKSCSGKCGLLDPGTSQGHNLRRSDTDHRK